MVKANGLKFGSEPGNESTTLKNKFTTVTVTETETAWLSEINFQFSYCTFTRKRHTDTHTQPDTHVLIFE